eukprot:RCo027787
MEGGVAPDKPPGRPDDPSTAHSHPNLPGQPYSPFRPPAVAHLSEGFPSSSRYYTEQRSDYYASGSMLQSPLMGKHGCTPRGIRRALRKMLRSRAHALLTILVILANVAILCTFDRTNPTAPTQTVIRESRVYFNAIFAADVALAVIARGPTECLRDGWFLLEALTVVLGFLTYLPGMVDFTGIRLLLGIKYMSRVPFLRKTEIMTTALYRSLPLLRDFFLLALMFFLFFGILGVQLFGGRFGYRCVDPVTQTQVVDFWYGTDPDKVCSRNPGSGFQCPGNSTCVDLRVNPQAGTISYDTILQAWLTNFEVLSTENWSVVLYHSFDATSGAAYLFHGSVVFIGMYLLVQSIAAVVTTKLSEVCAEYAEDNAADPVEVIPPEAANPSPEPHSNPNPEPSPNSPNSAALLNHQDGQSGSTEAPKPAFESPAGAVALDIIPLALQPVADPGSSSTGPRSPSSAVGMTTPLDPAAKPESLWMRFRGFVRAVIRHRFFEAIVVSTIVANILALAVPFYGMNQETLDQLGMANKVFTCLFAAEATLRLLGDGPLAYFRDRSNVFDFCIVLIGILDDFVLSGASTGLP